MLLPATLLLLLGAVGLNRQVIQDNPHILNAHIKRPVLLNSETEAGAVFTVSHSCLTSLFYIHNFRRCLFASV